MKKIVTFAVMCSTALYTILPAAAFADTVPDPIADPTSAETLAAMQLQCDNLAAAHDTGNGDEWTGEVVEGSVTKVSGPTEVAGTRVIDEDSIVGIGTPTYGGIHIAGDPYRNGGSVNMFGAQRATDKTWPDSTYNFTADFDTTFAHAFSCDIYQAVFHPAVHIPGHKIQGYYINCDFGHGQGNDNGGTCEDVGQPQGSCLAHNNVGESLPFWGEDTEQCKFIVTGPAVDPVDEDAYLDDPVFVVNEAGMPVNQDQTDSLEGFEDHGGTVTAHGDFFVAQVVVCISPAKGTKGIPGVWTKQNGYTGDKCNAAWYQGTTPYSLANYAGTNVPNLNDGSHNWVTIPGYQQLP